MEYIEIKNLNKKFNYKYALKDINLKIKKGEIFGIIGLSGAGKSTLIRMINKLENPDTGEIYVDNEDINTFDNNKILEYRKKCSMIFQHFNLLSSRTVFENIALTLEISKYKRDYIEKRVMELLKLVHLEDFKDTYINNLSGGQKQRVAIARALANNPKILLSDEATSALDPITSNKILELLKEINEKLNITIVLITHQMEVVKKICDNVAVMKNGEIIEVSTVKELFLNPKTEFSKSLVNEVIGDEKDFKNAYKLVFDGEQADIPYISRLVKEFMIDINILSGNINRFAESKVGFLVVEFKSPNSQMIIEWLENHGVRVEIYD